MNTESIRGPAGRIEIRRCGHGRAVIMIASLGRSATDFDDLGLRIARAGYSAVAPEPRGIGGTDRQPDGDRCGLDDLADDVAAVIEHVGAPAHVMGHAFGNRVARMTATIHRPLVSGVILLGCGGAVLPEPDVGRALLDVFDETLSSERHLDAVRRAFFAPDNDPTAWRGGWFPDLARMQGDSMTGIDTSRWWGAGDADVLVVQATDDVIATPANSVRLMADLGERGELATLVDAGHAMLPEQPERLAAVIIDWLDRH